MKWFIYALLAMIFFSGMVLIFKKLMIIGLDTPKILLGVFIGGAFFYGIHILFFSGKNNASITWLIIGLIVLAALLSYLGNLFMLRSMEIASNPGFTVGVVSLQAILITLGAWMLFQSSLSSTKIVGLVLALVALVLLGV